MTPKRHVTIVYTGLNMFSTRYLSIHYIVAIVSKIKDILTTKRTTLNKFCTSIRKKIVTANVVGLPASIMW